MDSQKVGCLRVLGEGIGMLVIAFVAFWILWFLNALVIGVYSSFSDNPSGKILAAVASVGELLILWALDRTIGKRKSN